MYEIMTAQVAHNQDVVKVSGRGALLNIRIDDSVPVEVACRSLREVLGRNRQLYSHGEVEIDAGARINNADQLARIRRVIESESGLTIKTFSGASGNPESGDATVAGEAPAGVVRDVPTDGHGFESGTPLSDASAAGGDDPAMNESTRQDAGETGHAPVHGNHRTVPADILRGTCRAGDVLNFPGNVVVMGNVNPGAQIIAQGDILIFGTLRGTAHAGAGGDSTAVILAMSSVRPQLRIAGVVGEADPPAGGSIRDKGGANPPIIARIRNRTIEVAPYMQNRGLDHGGRPNER